MVRAGKGEDDFSAIIEGARLDLAAARRAGRVEDGAEAVLSRGTRRAGQKIGLDANRPINPRTGRIEAQVADPEVIASTGAGWVRLNFVLRPWASLDDNVPYAGRTWEESYAQIISGFRDRGLRVYGLIGVESMAQGPGERLRKRPAHGDAKEEWVEQYVEQFLSIVEMFHKDVHVFESFNEPDDWHGKKLNWVHPGWFAIMLQRLYIAVRSSPELDHVKMVSGPLQGLEANRNAAADYLQSTYQAGKRWFGWGQDGIPFPFDGIGYHLYVKNGFNPNKSQQERAIRTTLRRYLQTMHQVIRSQEGGNRPLYVSEMGWNSRVEPREIQRREEFQARCLKVGLDTVCADPLVELGVWFCTQDFGIPGREASFGLYRSGPPGPEQRKPAFRAFRDLCREGVEEEERAAYTNRQLLDAFYWTGVDLGMRRPWNLLAKAGLSLSKLVADRRGLYEGPPTSELPGLTEAEKGLIQARLDEQAEAFPGGSEDPSIALATKPPATLDADLSFDVTVALQEQILGELEENRRLLEQVLARLDSQEPRSNRLLGQVRERLPIVETSDGGILEVFRANRSEGMYQFLERVRGLLA